MSRAQSAASRAGACEIALGHAAAWLIETAQIRDELQPFENPAGYPHRDFTGAMRTEYDTKTRVWSINGPVFHTGQAIRAMLVAERRTGETRFRDAAELGAAFLLRERIDAAGHPQRGLLMSLEQNDDEINVQVTIEALSGLIDLHDVTGDVRFLDAVRESCDVLIRDGYLAADRLMQDHYSLAARAFVRDAENPLPGRAMVDDAVLMKLAARTGDDRFREVFLAMASRLLDEEGPPGTWLRFPPWRPDQRRIHNRKSWWWGWPLLAAFDETSDRRFLEGAIRAADWFIDGQNLDGGAYYTPDPDGRHNSFGLCTSVVAVSVLFWADLWQRTRETRYLVPIQRAVGFLLAAQFAQDVEDASVRGALWESPRPPDGSLAPGFRVRDIASIFAIRAFDAVLAIPDLLLANEMWADTSMKW